MSYWSRLPIIRGGMLSGRHHGHHAERWLWTWSVLLLLAFPVLSYGQSANDGFNPSPNGNVIALAVQANGKILVGGIFSTLGGQPRIWLGRLNTDGNLDLTFNPSTNSWVHALAVQADSKILVGGDFSTLGGQPRSRIGRLNADGSLDPTFNPGANDWVRALAVQADSKAISGKDYPM